MDMKAGDFVRLVYGGPTMVVLLVTKAGVTCEWLDDEGNVRIVTYNPAALTK